MIAILILGFKLSENLIGEELKGRMNVGINQFFNCNADYLILSGGKTNPIYVPECEIMKEYAIKFGVDPNKIITECKSLDTIGNFFFTRKIFDKLYEIEKIYCISSCYHMKRVKFIFQKCFGSKYSANFSFCFEIEGDLEHEEKSIHQANNFFHDIQDGDIERIGRKIFTDHSLYKHCSETL